MKKIVLSNESWKPYENFHLEIRGFQWRTYGKILLNWWMIMWEKSIRVSFKFNFFISYHEAEGSQKENSYKKGGIFIRSLKRWSLKFSWCKCTKEQNSEIVLLYLHDRKLFYNITLFILYFLKLILYPFYIS